MPYVRLEPDGGKETAARTQPYSHASQSQLPYLVDGFDIGRRHRPPDLARLRQHGLQLGQRRRARHEMGRPSDQPPDDRPGNQGLGNNRLLHLHHVAERRTDATNSWSSSGALNMSGPTQGQGQQNGDAHVGGSSILEIDQWEFTPTQKLGAVVTNVTGGFEGQIRGATGGKGSIRIVVPKTGYTAPIVAGAYTILNLYADAARLHGYTQIYAEFESAPTKIELISDKAIGITINFKANGPYNATGASPCSAVNNEVTSSSGT